VDEPRPAAPDADDSIAFTKCANGNRANGGIQSRDVAASGENRDCPLGVWHGRERYRARERGGPCCHPERSEGSAPHAIRRCSRLERIPLLARLLQQREKARLAANWGEKWLVLRQEWVVEHAELDHPLHAIEGGVTFADECVAVCHPPRKDVVPRGGLAQIRR